MKSPEIGSKVRNRHTGESGVVIATAVNECGLWVYAATQSGMSIGWWHETDIAEAPRSVPPKTKRQAA